MRCPGPFPGRVVEVKDPRSLVDDKIDAKVVAEMFERGVRTLTGKDMKESFALFFEPGDVVGIKVNPVGPPLINTHVELADAVVKWLVDNKVPPEQHRHLGPLRLHAEGRRLHAGPVPEGVRIEGLQTMDETGNTWKDANGNHVSIDNFDKDVFYFAKGVVGQGRAGLQGRRVLPEPARVQRRVLLLRQAADAAADEDRQPGGVTRTRAHGISMATKNMGYGSVCNTGRLHAPLFFNVCTEVLAAPVVRDKLVLNVTDGAPRAVRRRAGQERAVRLREPLALLRHRPVRARHDLPPAARREAEGDGGRGERESPLHRLPALRRAAGARGREAGEDSVRQDLGIQGFGFGTGFGIRAGIIRCAQWTTYSGGRLSRWPRFS